MKLLESIKKDFNTMTCVLIPVAIAINVVIGQIVALLKLPVYLDSIGTVLVGVICGPWAGALTGALANIIWGLAIDPNALPWWPVAFFIGFVAGWCANGGLFRNTWKVLVTGFFIALVAALTSAVINVVVFGGINASGSSLITAYLLQSGRGMIDAVLSTNFLVEPVDKISTALLAFAIIRGLSVRYLSRFPRPENASLEKDERTALLIGGGVFVVYVILVGSFFNIVFLWVGLVVAAILVLATLLITVPRRA
jgi:energy-coupling factor transport system substrate-specific component